MDQRGGLQRVVLAFLAEAMVRQPAQFGVDEWNQGLERFGVALGPTIQKLTQVVSTELTAHDFRLCGQGRYLLFPAKVNGLGARKPKIQECGGPPPEIDIRFNFRTAHKTPTSGGGPPRTLFSSLCSPLFMTQFLRIFRLCE